MEIDMKTKIFIDGSEGTTGLRIFERFEGRDDIELLTIPYKAVHTVEVVSSSFFKVASDTPFNVL